MSEKVAETLPKIEKKVLYDYQKRGMDKIFSTLENNASNYNLLY